MTGGVGCLTFTSTGVCTFITALFTGTPTAIQLQKAELQTFNRRLAQDFYNAYSNNYIAAVMEVTQLRVLV